MFLRPRYYGGRTDIFPEGWAYSYEHHNTLSLTGGPFNTACVLSLILALPPRWQHPGYIWYLVHLKKTISIVKTVKEGPSMHITGTTHAVTQGQ
jgi:hypothetical protein